jgi:hypothetical protein
VIITRSERREPQSIANQHREKVRSRILIDRNHPTAFDFSRCRPKRWSRLVHTTTESAKRRDEEKRKSIEQEFQLFR